MEKQNEMLQELYFQTKDLFQRNKILKQILCNMPIDAKEFFLEVFKKERYLDMKLSAVRGYAAYATEDEVCILMDQLLDKLKMGEKKTPYNYTEYEPMRSVFLMPYLLNHYNYSCFRIFNEQLEKQYNRMPDCFKNIFTLDEQGNLYNTRDPNEVRRSLDLFFYGN